MNKLQKELFKISDKEYALFQSKLTPNVDASLFIGVRVPVLRKFAKEYARNEESKLFLNDLPHKYYDENMLHALLISSMKDYDQIIESLDKFLPYIDNWAVCDILSPKYVKKNKEKFLVNIKKWIKSKHTYTCRFGIEMLMSFYLDDDFKEEYLKIVASIRFEDYYVRMMIAWFFQAALTKKWDYALPYIENKTLDCWTHNKAIQKAVDSYCISDENKEYLKSLRIKDKK